MAKYTIRLPRLPVNWKDQPGLFERYWDEAMSEIERSLNQLLELPEIQRAIDAANLAAQNANEAAMTAQGAAETAQGAADATAKETSLVNSYVSDFTAPLLLAAPDGTVTVALHKRVYGDSNLNPTVTVQGGSLVTTPTAGATVRIYYDDPERDGGSVTYAFTVDPAPPPVQGGNRHSVGVATIPAAGQPPSDGDYIKPPGYVQRNQLQTQQQIE